MAALMHLLGRAVRSAGDGLLDIALPRRCGLCGRFDTFLCESCRAGLPVAAPPRCAVCWSNRATGRTCRDCATALIPSLAGVRAPYTLDGDARELVHALKYQGLSALAGPMGEQMAACLTAWGLRPDLIIPVPLHPRRLRWRGFNQAAELARPCARAVNAAYAPTVLRRTRHTTPQVRTEGAAARRANIAGAFAVTEPWRVVGRDVLLVDDVCTSAATLRACAEPLRAAGARAVYGLAFARE